MKINNNKKQAKNVNAIFAPKTDLHIE